MATLTQWHILKCLSKRKKGTKEIQEALQKAGISLTLRSVQRNLEKLSETFPITSDHKNPAGWKWADDCDLFDLPVMDISAALTLRLVEQHLLDMLPGSFVDTIHPYIRRAHKLLDEAAGQGVGEWPKRVARISRRQKLIPPEIEAEVMDAVFQSVLESRQLAVKYQRLGDSNPADRILHPQGLVFDEGVIYLVATAWGYKDVRQFALHRMVAANVLEQTANQVEGFSLEKYIAEGNFSFPRSDRDIRLKMRVGAWLGKYLEENRLSLDQQISKEGDGFLVEACVRDTAQLRWWILGLGTHVEVLGPVHLREAIWETIEKLYHTYAEGGDSCVKD
ncbi:helix-turn-helix transcriptional regulator [Geothermobacter hydrogeniphilus]|nr:WYL domain-containing protein [Geothermobacter hydrogeniphilus]